MKIVNSWSSHRWTVILRKSDVPVLKTGTPDVSLVNNGSIHMPLIR